MVFTPFVQALFRRSRGPLQPSPTPTDESGDDELGNPLLTSSEPQPKRKREHATPQPLKGLFEGEQPCCMRLRCADMFRDARVTSHDANLLAAEQEQLFRCGVNERDRKRVISEHVPHVRPPHGSMIAAGRPVCTRFFAAAFGCSKNLIDAVKGLPGARASSLIERCDLLWARQRRRAGQRFQAHFPPCVSTTHALFGLVAVHTYYYGRPVSPHLAQRCVVRMRTQSLPLVGPACCLFLGGKSVHQFLPL